MNAKTAFLFLAVLLFVRPSVYSQTTLTAAANAARDGDSLVMRHLDVASPGSAGRGVVWDLSGADPGKRCILQYAVDSCSQTALGQYTSWRTVMSGDTLFLTGFENRHTLMEFDGPLPLLRYPFAYGDSIRGSFHGVGKWCDRTFMRVWGDGVTRADAAGTLILPSGDTLRHVLRTHTLRRTWQASVDSVRTWESLRHAASRDIVCVKEAASPVISEEFAWYAPGWRYPVVRLESTGDAQGTASLATLFPPVSQAGLPYDMENALLRPLDGFPSPEKGHDPPGGAMTSRSAGYDPASGALTVTFTLSRAAAVSLLVSDVSGVAWRSAERTFGGSGTYTIALNCSGLPRGHYALRVTCGPDFFTDKFNVR